MYLCILVRIRELLTPAFQISVMTLRPFVRDAAPSHGGSRRGHETRGQSAHRLVEQRGCPLVVSVTLVQDVLQELSMKGESDFEFLNVPVELILQVWETKTKKQRSTT